MSDGLWVKELPISITVCDAQGIIIEMNEKSCQVFEKRGGRELIGDNVLDCHPEKAGKKIKEIMESQTINCYITERNGVKRMVYQSPWYQEGKYRGIVEFIMELPNEVQCLKR